MIILDSNIIISALKEGEINTQKAQKILEQDETFLVFDFIISEIYTVLLIRASYKRAVDFLHWVKADPRFEISIATEEEYKKTDNFLTTTESKLSFIDAQLLIISKEREYPLLTFDELLRKKHEQQ